MNLWSWIPIICYYGFFACGKLSARKKKKKVSCKMICPFSTEAQNIPVFTANPQGGVYRPGVTLSLSCTATGSLSIQWIQNDLILNSSQVFISGETFTLGIFVLTPAQTGSYRCIAVGSGGVSVTSSVALVQIAGKSKYLAFITSSDTRIMLMTPVLHIALFHCP